MRQKQLGHSSLKVSALCLGGNVFGWTADEPTSFRLLDAFMDAGGNFVDTANVYRNKAPGRESINSEAFIGRWMKERGNRNRVILATKVGSQMTHERKGLAKAYILEEVEESLRRLQTDYIDLYISHRADPNTPIEETLEAYDLLLKQGKIRFCGASNCRSAVLREAHEVSLLKGLPEYQSLQPQYNLYERGDFESYLQPVCEKLGLGVTPYFSLAMGFLTGKYRSEADLSKSPRGKEVGKYLNPRGFRILQSLDEVARENATSLTAIALAWLMQKPVVTSAIASATSTEQMRELIAATHLQLSPTHMELLDKASALESQ